MNVTVEGLIGIVLDEGRDVFHALEHLDVVPNGTGHDEVDQDDRCRSASFWKVMPRGEGCDVVQVVQWMIELRCWFAE